mmetsp:Transcript_7759/g.11371  ORF Transcript_7759/g.11371 Transcript_7759/m.11371 type:complete len:391 (+) Transcript_7759:81-1253(+)|eukprot:CAMPEP_0197237566 /NCGR_PEP_ID=MMETSP1429-20130617/4364_1 /TAXON_ID=49237 /ORGANISM="Chaetoceros  sp., Strain UNC1202" /LENGTH=390 /DNA_ID=CAMNT_0042696589 /DNA_START=10 /DNA_END=1182 /DNA_ORIENTATION=-
MSKTLHRSLEAKLAALDGPAWDSSDEEIDEVKSTQKIVNNKKQAITAKSQRQKSKDKVGEDATSRVIYIGHIPPAFEEPQILEFVSQFGKVTNIKLSRSKRTGNPRGYAFVELADDEVAAIVADTMSGYFLMGERRLVCHVVPKDKIHPDLFKHARENLAKSQNGEFAPSIRLKMIYDRQRKAFNSNKSEDALKKITKRLLSREKKKRDQFKKLGIDYDFPGYAASAERSNVANNDRKRKVSEDANDGEIENVHAIAQTSVVEVIQQNPKKLKKTAATPQKSTKRKGSEEGMAVGRESKVTRNTSKKSKTPKRKTRVQVDAPKEETESEMEVEVEAGKTSKTGQSFVEQTVKDSDVGLATPSKEKKKKMRARTDVKKRKKPSTKKRKSLS